MNNIEEILWNYIDGNCTPDEQKAVNALIAGDEAVRIKYNELLNVDAAFSAMELDEPPMAFTYNVIEAIRTEQAQKPLKATINKRIILGIAIFFGFTILALLIFTLTNINWAGQAGSINITAGLKMPAISTFITKPVIQGFLFFDIIMGLFLFDAYLRGKKASKQF